MFGDGDGDVSKNGSVLSVIFRTSIPLKERNALLLSATCK